MNLLGSDGVFASPFASGSFISGTISLVDMRNLGNQGIIGVGVCKHRADREQHFGDCESRTPLVSQDVKTDTAVRVDVGVIDSGSEIDLRRLEWVVGREMNGQEEDTSRVWRVTRTHNCCLPVKQIISYGTSRAGRRRVTA